MHLGSKKIKNKKSHNALYPFFTPICGRRHFNLAPFFSIKKRSYCEIVDFKAMTLQNKHEWQAG